MVADVIAVRALGRGDRDRVGSVLPLHRLGQPRARYLVAWDGDAAVGHVCIDWRDPAELQDLWVLPERRGEGIGATLVAAVEAAAAKRGRRAVRLSVGIDNDRARALYERLGYVRTATPPRRVKATIQLRAGPFDVDDTLLELEKPLTASGVGA